MLLVKHPSSFLSKGKTKAEEKTNDKISFN